MGTNKPWKIFERQVAKKLGGTRIGPSGRETNDVEHPEFAIECKYRKAVPCLIKDGLLQAKNNGAKHKTPVLFIKTKGSPKDVVVMYATDFYDWFGIESRINGKRIDDKGEE